jgi:hypothetical protein
MALLSQFAAPLNSFTNTRALTNKGFGETKAET